MNKLSIIIVSAPHHYTVSQEAIDSAQAQTVECDVIFIGDDEMNGAGWARNVGLEKVNTEFCAFLDADDTLDPLFAYHTLNALSHYAQSHTDERYAYSSWYGLNNAIHRGPLPCVAWTEQTNHLVTAVVPTHRAKLIGGFDENMPGVEDADFYVRLRLSGLCGIHVDDPLVHYREGGQRSIAARDNGDDVRILQYMTNRYGGFNLMGCCGDNSQHPITAANEPREGDILVQALWHGNRVERGRKTGRLYPRTAFPYLMYVNEQDVNASGHLWQRVTSPQQASNGVVLLPEYKSDPQRPWQDIANAVFGSGQPAPVQSSYVEYKPNVPGRSKKDVVTQAQGWSKVKGEDL